MNLSEIRKDVILFKDETLRMVREIGKQLFEGMRQKSLEMDSKIDEIDSSKYVFQFAPIVQKYQYYRIITRYFIHFGVCHLSL